ncbi:MAG TPA: Gfo/Idh/MocA family oxidoreductase [Candidatus Paceibacterota bacterium]|nr:Gfo/Idh/MocA family oxidoreductase [Candidatus Paceibacterota bacterium]
MKTQMNRRDFLRSSTAALAAISLPAIIPASAFGAGNKIALGCIGVGGMGTGNMKSFLALEDCRVVAVCDTYEDRRQKAKNLADTQYGDKGCAMHDDYREVIARKDIDAVMIAAQDHWHALIATAAAAAGKDMYLEKPMGTSVEQSQKILRAVRKHKRVFQAGTWQRSQGKFRQACALVRNGYIGSLREMQVGAPGPQYQPKYAGSLEPQPVPAGFNWEMWRGPAPANPYNPGRVAWPDWYLIWDYCAGFICNWGVHYLDIAYWGCPALATEPCELECQGVYRKKGLTDNIESWNATFTLASGVKMVFTDVSTEQEEKTGTRFIGDKGWVHVSRAGIRAEPESLLQVRPKAGETHLYEVPGEDVTIVRKEGGDRAAFKELNHGQNFLDCVRSRKDPISNVEATHVASYLGLIAEIAARLQTRLKWDPKKEKFIGNREANQRLSRALHNGWKL